MTKITLPVFVFVTSIFLATFPFPTNGLIPFGRALWDIDDPFRVLEQTPFPVPRPNSDGPGTTIGMAALARADWKETQSAHVITLDVPGMRRDDINVEVEENRVVRVSGERRAEEEHDGDKWHRAERTSGRFWRQFRLPSNSDLDRIQARLEDGVLRITIPKLAEEKRRPKVVDISGENTSGAQEVKASKADM